MDNDTAALILQVQLDDIASILASSTKGKNRATDDDDDDDESAAIDDQEYALRLQQEELEASASILRQRRIQMGQSNHNAGSPKKEEEEEEEEKATTSESSSTEANKQTEQPSSPNFAAASAASAAAVASPPHHRCSSCLEPHPPSDIAKIPACGHLYCRTCLDTLFRHSLADESLFPPRCCEPIPFKDDDDYDDDDADADADAAIRAFLPASTAREFASRRAELSTAERTYCHDAGCGAWIPPAAIAAAEGVGVCAACAARTCAVCKAEAHGGGEDCPEDEATGELLAMAERSGWRRCFQCRRVVELGVGCNHIVCRCGAQFCYVCGVRWKTCGCPQWHEPRLLAQE